MWFQVNGASVFGNTVRGTHPGLAAPNVPPPPPVCSGNQPLGMPDSQPEVQARSRIRDPILHEGGDIDRRILRLHRTVVGEDLGRHAVRVAQLDVAVRQILAVGEPVIMLESEP